MFGFILLYRPSPGRERDKRVRLDDVEDLKVWKYPTVPLSFPAEQAGLRKREGEIGFDVVGNIVWFYSIAPLPLRCKEREKEGEAENLQILIIADSPRLMAQS